MNTQAADSKFMGRPWVWKTASVTFALYVFVLISIYIFAANRSVAYSYTVTGQKEIHAGWPTNVRIGVFDIVPARYLPGASVRLSLVLDPMDPAVELFRGDTSSAGFVDASFVVPATAPEGAAKWLIEVGGDGDYGDEISVPVTIGPPPASRTSTPFADALVQVSKGKVTKAPQSGTGPVRIDMIPEGHTATDGVETVMFLYTTSRESSEPVSAKVEVKVEKGLVTSDVPRSITTGPSGLAEFRVTPVGAQIWKLRVGAPPGTKTEDKAPNPVGQPSDIKIAPTPVPVVLPVGAFADSEREIRLEGELKQYSMVIQSPVWGEADTLKVGVLSLHTKGGVYGDIYLDDAWLYGEVTGLDPSGGGFEIAQRHTVRPTSGIWFAQAQVYGHPLQPQTAVDVRLIVLPSPQMSELQVTRAVIARAQEAGVETEQANALLRGAWLATASEEDLALHTRFWLSRAAPTAHLPRILLDTQGGEKTQIADEKEDVRSIVTTLLIISLGLALAIILYLVLLNFIRVRARTREMVRELADDLDEVAIAGPDSLVRMQAIAQIVFLLATIAMFFVSLVILLQNL